MPTSVSMLSIWTIALSHLNETVSDITSIAASVAPALVAIASSAVLNVSAFVPVMASAAWYASTLPNDA